MESWPVLKVLFHIVSEEKGEKHDKPHYNRTSGMQSKLTLRGYKIGMLTTQ
jgi:hypothetical protein